MGGPAGPQEDRAGGRAGEQLRQLQGRGRGGRRPPRSRLPEVDGGRLSDRRALRRTPAHRAESVLVGAAGGGSFRQFREFEGGTQLRWFGAMGWSIPGGFWAMGK